MTLIQEDFPDQETDPSLQNLKLVELLNLDMKNETIHKVERIERDDEAATETGWRFFFEQIDD